MDAKPGSVVRYEPDAWFVIFQERVATPWVQKWTPGRFKHVLALGYVQAAGVWLAIDPLVNRMGVVARPDDAATHELIAQERAKGRTLLVVPGKGRPVWQRLGCWCVPLVAHLVGSRSCALFPDGLWRDLLAEGAQEMTDGEGVFELRRNDGRAAGAHRHDRARRGE